MTERGTTTMRETSSWSGHLRNVDRALGQSDLAGARLAWENAHLAAVESLSWEGLIATGHACLRIGGAMGAWPTAEARARRAYFAALYRACRENSFDGILRAAEAFDNLGDREVVEECLGLAELQVDGDATRQRLSALVGRLRGKPAPEAAPPHVDAGPLAAGIPAPATSSVPLRL